MTTTHTTDITTYNQEMANLIILLALRKTPILNSPTFQTDPLLANQLLKSGEGGLPPRSLAIPYLAPLEAGSSVISDNPADIIVGKKISGGKSTVYKESILEYSTKGELALALYNECYLGIIGCLFKHNDIILRLLRSQLDLDLGSQSLDLRLSSVLLGGLKEIIRYYCCQ